MRIDTTEYALVTHERSGVTFARVRVARSNEDRVIGLLTTPSLPQGSGLLITPAVAIHTYGMQYPIDVLFLETAARGQLVMAGSTLKPRANYSITVDPVIPISALELPAGTIDSVGIRPGDWLLIAPAA